MKITLFYHRAIFQDPFVVSGTLVHRKYILKRPACNNVHYLTFNKHSLIKGKRVLTIIRTNLVSNLKKTLVYSYMSEYFVRNKLHLELKWKDAKWVIKCISNHLCNQCLSPLTLWVPILLRRRCTRYNILW